MPATLRIGREGEGWRERGGGLEAKSARRDGGVCFCCLALRVSPLMD